MTANIVDEFVNYLSARHFNAASLLAKLNSVARRNGERTLKDLWEASDLSANDFADEVAQFYRLPRVALPQLIAAPALTAKFSRRFLRETLVFPYAAEDGRPRLVLPDPTDAAAVRAAEIVLGAPVAVEIASYEDIATALTKRLGEDDEASSDTDEATTSRASRSSPASTSRSGACRRTAPRACALRAPSSMCASPRCRRSTANPP